MTRLSHPRSDVPCNPIRTTLGGQLQMNTNCIFKTTEVNRCKLRKCFDCVLSETINTIVPTVIKLKEDKLSIHITNAF